MKKNILTFGFILFTFMQLFASSTTVDDYGHYGKGESFNFMEGNVHFMVFQNGEFDFFIEQPNISVGVNVGNVSITFNSGYNYDNYVLYDDYGAIIQIEDIPIYYDYYGRISRIGDTYIRYRNRRLIQFGGMYVHYNPYGYFDYCSGYVNVYNRHYNYRPYVSYFARPVYTHCIVSYEPYRRYYRPTRYRYNSTEFRRRARNNSYYRNTSSRVVRRRAIPKRVAPEDRRSVRRSNSAVRSHTPNRRQVSTRRNNEIRKGTSNRNTSVRRSTKRTATNRTVTRKPTVRTKPTTRNHRKINSRNTTTSHRGSTINSRVNRSNKRSVNNKKYTTRKLSPRKTATHRSSNRSVANTNRRTSKMRR